MKRMTMPMKLPEVAEIDTGTFRKLQSLVAQGESEVLEFKRKAAHPEKIICEMIAFANTKGGKLLIGVADDGTIPGVKHPEDEIIAIRQALSTFCRPEIKFRYTVMAISPNKYVIEYDILKSRRKLHSFKTADGTKEAYVRFEDKTIRASAEMCQVIRRYSSRRNIKFRYGENESRLMKYLEGKTHINLEGYRTLTGLNRYNASRSLVTLVLADILHITPTDKGDLYRLHSSFAATFR